MASSPLMNLTGSLFTSLYHHWRSGPARSASEVSLRCRSKRSPMGHKRSFRDPIGMSAPGGRADVFRQNADIRISMSDCRGCPAGRVCARGPPGHQRYPNGRQRSLQTPHGLWVRIVTRAPDRRWPKGMVTVGPYQLASCRRPD